MMFDPELSSADVDLVALADRVAQSRSLALSFLLSGLPGAGKSAFARYLAERLDLELVEKRYSDLVSMWLGESEKAIVALSEIFIDPELAELLGLVDGGTLPHGSRPTVRCEPGLGRQVRSKAEQANNMQNARGEIGPI